MRVIAIVLTCINQFIWICCLLFSSNHWLRANWTTFFCVKMRPLHGGFTPGNEANWELSLIVGEFYVLGVNNYGTTAWKQKSLKFSISSLNNSFARMCIVISVDDIVINRCYFMSNHDYTSCCFVIITFPPLHGIYTTFSLNVTRL